MLRARKKVIVLNLTAEQKFPLKKGGACPWQVGVVFRKSDMTNLLIIKVNIV
jgi:hypothetical protein